MASVNGTAANGHASVSTKKGPKIVIIGAGVNGLASAVWLRDQFHYDNFVILDRASEWWTNRYPGLSCDIPATLYQFSWDPNPDWTSPYPMRDELVEYHINIAKKHALYPFIRFNTAVTSLIFNEQTNQWHISLAHYPSEDAIAPTSTSEITCDIVLDFHKPINEPGFPAIEGAGWNKDHKYYLRNPSVQPLGKFGGQVMHSMVYDKDFDLTGKRVALIGCAAAWVESSVARIERSEITQTIAPDCGHLYVYHRTPEWILPRDDAPWPESQKKEWRENPLEYAVYRGKYNRIFFDLWWGAMYRADSPQSLRTRELVLENMHAHIKDPKLRKILTPDYPPWARRVLVSSKFYPTLMRDNVTLCHERVLRITEKGVVSSTEDPRKSAVPAGAPIPPPEEGHEIFEREVDVIIFATGWAQGIEMAKRMIPVVGRGGKSMGQHFFEQGEPMNYMGMMVDGFPNYYTPAGAGSLPADTFQRAGEICLSYFLQLLDRMIRENLATIEPTREAVITWDNLVAKMAQGMAMLTPGVKSYYKTMRADGSVKLFGFFPATDDEMAVVFRKVQWEHLICTPRADPW